MYLRMGFHKNGAYEFHANVLFCNDFCFWRATSEKEKRVVVEIEMFAVVIKHVSINKTTMLWIKTKTNKVPAENWNSLHFAPKKKRANKVRRANDLQFYNMLDVEVFSVGPKRQHISMRCAARAKCQNTQFRFSLIESMCTVQARLQSTAFRKSNHFRTVNVNPITRHNEKKTGIFSSNSYGHWVEERLPQRSGNGSGAIQYHSAVGHLSRRKRRPQTCKKCWHIFWGSIQFQLNVSGRRFGFFHAISFPFRYGT